MNLTSSKTLPKSFLLASPAKDSEVQVHDWLFINYTYKRFDGLTAKPKLKLPTSTTN